MRSQTGADPSSVSPASGFLSLPSRFAKGAKGPTKSTGAKSAMTWCWAEQLDGTNLVLHVEGASTSERCSERHKTLAAAKVACEGARPWCGGITKDSGLPCNGAAQKLEYELRLADKMDGDSPAFVKSWLLLRVPKNSTRCEGSAPSGARRAVRAAQRSNPTVHLTASHSLSAAAPGDRLSQMLHARLAIAQRRMERGPPAFERFPEQAFRYRDWGAQTRHGRGDMYPLYTLDTLRNMADFLFDSSTGYESGPERARQVPACSILYSTLRPTSKFVNLVHNHIRVPYLLMTDTADEAITPYHGVKQLLGSSTLHHWWAVDNEVLDQPKLEGLPLGVMDALEIGGASNPSSVAFHANVSEYIATLITSHSQPKRKWLMMQMTETHPERRVVRRAITHDTWGEGDVRLTPERRGKMGVREYLMELGRHRFVLSPRGNGLDAHRTWEALLVGAIPIVRSSALNPLYEGLPVLIVDEWTHVTPQLLTDFLRNHTIRLPLYQYERLFADYWVGAFSVQRERCLAEERAKKAPRYVYDYQHKGGWAAVDFLGRHRPPPVWTRDAVRGGR